MPRLTEKQKQKIVADYIQHGNYSEVGRRHKVSSCTVRRLAKANGVGAAPPAIGAVPMFKSVEEMQKKIDAYFESCKGELLKDENENLILDKYGTPVLVNQKPPTVTGLALGIGFNSRQALLNYQVKDDFNDAITRAKSKVEEYAESRLFDRDGAMGAKFSLSNNFKEWSEKQNIGLSGEVVTIVDDL